MWLQGIFAFITDNYFGINEFYYKVNICKTLSLYLQNSVCVLAAFSILTTAIATAAARNNNNKTYDPLGQTHSLASRDHGFHFVWFASFKKWRRSDDTCENNDPYRPWLWVGRLDQQEEEEQRNFLKGKEEAVKKASKANDRYLISGFWKNNTHKVNALLTLIESL